MVSNQLPPTDNLSHGKEADDFCYNHTGLRKLRPRDVSDALEDGAGVDNSGRGEGREGSTG